MAMHSRFTDAVAQSQAVFRVAMMAMARPGQIGEAACGLSPPAPMMPATAALMLALADFETPVWLDSGLADSGAVRDWLKFETGAPLVAAAGAAAFALISQPLAMPALEDFAIGTLDNPHLSTTVVIQVGELRAAHGWALSGPGVVGQTRLHAAPLPENCLADTRGIHLLYPRGVDIFFVCGEALAALPRSVLIEA